jgi:hypothetical protein
VLRSRQDEQYKTAEPVKVTPGEESGCEEWLYDFREKRKSTQIRDSVAHIPVYMRGGGYQISIEYIYGSNTAVSSKMSCL